MTPRQGTFVNKAITDCVLKGVYQKSPETTNIQIQSVFVLHIRSINRCYY